MATATVTIADFISGMHITMTAERTNSNPSMPDSSNMDHWKCLLRWKLFSNGKPIERRMTVYFSMGYGHNGKAPNAADVLDCLSSDAASIENSPDFESWASDFGYETDSRKAERAFKACEHQAKRLQNFLGEDAYQQLLWNTERL